MNDRDKIHIELYGNDIFQGYVKSVSVAKQKVESTYKLEEARPFASEYSALKCCTTIQEITNWALMPKLSH